MSFLTALLGAAGGYGVGRQQALQNKEEQQRLASETQYQEAETEQAKTDANIRAAQAGYQLGPNGKLSPLPLTGKYLPIPKGATYDQIATTVAQNYAQSIEQNDPQGIQTWGDAAKSIPRGYEEVAQGTYTAGAKTNLTNAQADFWRNWKSRLKMQYDAALQKVGAQQSGAMQRAYVSAGAAMARTQYNGDEREAIAIQTALNVAQGKSYQDAYNMAKDKADAQDRFNLEAWKVQASAAEKAGQPLPAMPQPTSVNVQTGTPVVTVNVVDPHTGQIRQVSNLPVNRGGAAVHRVSASDAENKLKGVPADQRGAYINEAVKNGWLSAADAAQVRSFFGLTDSGARGF